MISAEQDRSGRPFDHTDTSAPTAADAHTPSLPREQVQGSVHFISGGIGLREAIALKRTMHRYSLTLEFRTNVNGKRRLLAGVPVTIRLLTGLVMFAYPSAGPFLLARLRPGKYEVIAGRHGETKRRKVEIRANGGEHLVFEWIAV